METEDDFVEKVINYMKEHFEIKPQVWSKCGQGRIDLVLKQEPKIYFGVECKRNDSKKGEDMGEYVKQAIRYTKYEFEVEPNTYQRIPIAICPPLSYKYFLMNERTIDLTESKYVTFGRHGTWHQDRHTENHEHHSFNGFLGSWGIGEIRKSWDRMQKWLYISHSNKPVWSSEKKYIWNGKLRMQNEIKGLDQRWYDAWLKKINAL